MATVSHVNGSLRSGAAGCAQMNITPSKMASLPKSLGLFGPNKGSLIKGPTKIKPGGCNPAKYGTRATTEGLSFGGGLGTALGDNGFQVFTQ